MLQKYEGLYNEWLKSFKSKLNSPNYNKTVSLYLLNKEIFELPNRKNNYNNELYQKFLEKNIINENKNFFLLNQKIWDIIKLDYPNETEVKIDGKYIHNKYIIIINKFIYYFYFINERQEIKEGYFRFQDKNQELQNILAMFYDYEINNFFREMNIKEEINDLQTIKYKGFIYFIRIKGTDIHKNDFVKKPKNNNAQHCNNINTLNINNHEKNNKNNKNLKKDSNSNEKIFFNNNEINKYKSPPNNVTKNNFLFNNQNKNNIFVYQNIKNNNINNNINNNKINNFYENDKNKQNKINENNKDNKKQKEPKQQIKEFLLL